MSPAIAKTSAVHLARVVFVADEKTPKQCFTRPKELRTTGVPTEFVVVRGELVSDCQEVERRLHERFSEYRVDRAREFSAFQSVKRFGRCSKKYNPSALSHHH